MKIILKVHESDSKLKILELTKQYYFVGRSKHAHVSINSAFVSSCHITLVLGREDKSFFYTAYDGNILTEKRKPSTNGLWINRQRYNKKILESGDIIGFNVTDTEQLVFPYLEYLEDNNIHEKPTETYESREGEAV